MDERELSASSPAVHNHTQSQQDITREPALAAFNAFYRRFFPRSVTFLMWQGVRLPDAAGITQVTMIKAHKYWSAIRDPDAWVRRVASRELAQRVEDHQ
jgi:DNA-directed RNA polymerase specialized sigma24 family protein